MSLDKWGKALRDVSHVTGWTKRDVGDFLKFVGFDKVVSVIAATPEAELKTLRIEWDEIVRGKLAAKEIRLAEMREVSRVANCRYSARKNRETARDRLAAGTIEVYRKPNIGS